MKGSEELILYADVLFAINFSMDFLALFISSMILHKKMSRKRMVLASLLGGLYGVLEVILPLNQIFSIILSVIVAFAMCLIAFFDKSIKRMIITNLMYWGVSAGLGGVMSLLYSFLNKLLAEVIANYSQSTAYNGARFFIIASITAIVSIIFSRIFTSKRDVKSTEITIRLDDKDFTMEALCDSGNMLRDPILAKPVVLVSNDSKIGKIIINKEDKKKRFIPYSDVSNSGILKGIIPEKVMIGDNFVDAIIAPIEKKDFAGYEALVPSKLL